MPSLGDIQASIGADIAPLQRALNQASAAMRQATQGMESSARAGTRGITESFDGVSRSASNMEGKLRAALLAFVGFQAAKGLATSLWDVAAGFEQMEAKLDVITKGRGKETLEEVNKIALALPVSTTAATDAFVRLSAMGLQPTKKEFLTLIDVASIFGDDVIGRLSLQLGQAQAKGKLMAQDLNIMAEAGINAKKYLTDAFKMPLDKLQESVIPVRDQISAIFEGMARDFEGASAKMAKSGKGIVEAFRSYATEIERRFMELGAYDEIKKQISEVTENTWKWFEANEAIIQQNIPKYIEGVKTALGGIWDFVKEHPELVEFGLVGFALLGRKGVVAGALAGEIYGQIKELFDTIYTSQMSILANRRIEISDRVKALEPAASSEPSLFGLSQETIDDYKVELKELRIELDLIDKTMDKLSKKEVGANIEAGKWKAVTDAAKSFVSEIRPAVSILDELANNAKKNNKALPEPFELSTEAAKELKEYVKGVGTAYDNLTEQAEQAGLAAEDGHWEAREAAEAHLESLRKLYAEGQEGEADALYQLQQEVNQGIAQSVKSMTEKNLQQYEHFLDRMQDLFVDVFRSIRDNGIDSFEDIFTAASGFLHDIQAEVFGQMVRNVMTGKSPGEGLSGFFGMGGGGGGNGGIGISTGWWNQPLFGGTSGAPTAEGDLAFGGMTRGQGALTAAFAASAIYDIYMQSAGMSKTSGMISGGISGGVSGGLAGGFIGGAMAGGTTTSWSGPYAAIGAAVGAIIGGIAGYLGGADAPEKAKFRLGSGLQVNPRYPSTETPFGTFGFDEAKVINTNQFKQQIETVGQATKVLADMMDAATISDIRTFMGDWQSGKAKGDIEAAEFEEQFVNYFHEIGLRWNSELGDWIANFDGTLDDLTSAILAHRDIMHEVNMVIDPLGTGLADINEKYDNYHLALQESVESVAEAAAIERARRIELADYAAAQQQAAAAEYEREQAELRRIAKLQQAYAEFQISLMPADVGQQATWGMIQKRWGLEDMDLPTGPESKALIAGLIGDENFVDRLGTMGEDDASQFMTDTMWVKALGDAFDQITATSAQSIESVLDLVSATEEINLYWDIMRDALITVGYEGELLTNIELARTKQLTDLSEAEAKAIAEKAAAEDRMYRDIEFQTGAMIGIYNELEIAQQGVTDQFMGYWESIKDTENAMEVFPLLAERYGIAMEQLNKQFKAAYYSALASLPGLSAAQNKEFALSAIGSKYGLAGTDVNKGMVDNLYGLAKSGDYSFEEVRGYLDSIGAATVGVAEFINDIGTLYGIFHPIEQAATGVADSFNDLANTIDSALQSIDDLLYRLTGGDLAPVQSMEFFENQYAQRLADARANPENVGDFTSFIPDMLDFMNNYGINYAELTTGVVGDLQNLREKISGQKMQLTVNLQVNQRQLGSAVADDIPLNSDLLTAIDRVIDLHVKKVIKNG